MRIVKGPNVKKLLTIAAAAAIIGATALPAGAVTQTGNVTVKWNVTVTANLTLNQNYSAAGAAQTTAPSILTSTGPGGTGTCTAAGVGSEAAGTNNFGNITPDASLSKNVDCLYKNAINAQVTTNSTNWNLGASSAALPAGATLCLYPNGYTFGTAPAALPATQSARATYADNATCAGAGALTVPTSANSTNMITADATQFTASAANIGVDLGLLLTPAAATGAQSVVMTYTLVAN